MVKSLYIIFFCFYSTFAIAQQTGKDSITAAGYLSSAKSVFFSDRPASLSNALSGLEIADQLHLETLRANFNNIIGVIYSYQAKYDLSLKYLNQALLLSKELKDVLLIAKVYNNIGLNYMQQGYHKKAIESSLAAAKLLSTIGNNDVLGGTYANISESYYSLKMFDKSIMYGDTALKYFHKANQLQGIANVYNTYGVIYSDQNQHTKALEYYFKSLKIKRDTKDLNGQANALTNIGASYIKLKQFDNALVNLKQAQKIYIKVNDPKGLAEVAQNMADLKLVKRDTSALSDTRVNYEYARKNTTIDQQRDIAYNLAGMYRDKKDYKNSLKYLTIYDKLKDSTINLGIVRQVSDMEAKYQSTQKQQQISLLNKQSVIQQLQISQRNTTISVIGVVSMLCLLLAYQAYRRYKIKQETKLQSAIIQQQILASKGIIEAEERERKRIAGELHDGIGQLFTAVKMNMEILVERFLIKQADADILAEKTMALVDESCNEVRSIAHQMMPNALIKSGLVSALRDFINKIPSDKIKISIETKGIDHGLESTTETVLYRVIQESVNNVIKHAKATALDILLLCDQNEITVSIEDNGKGFDMTSKDNFTGIGLKNMISRVEYLKGTVDISSSPGKGTLVAIFIPLI